MTWPATLSKRVWVPLVVLVLLSGTLAQLLGATPKLALSETSYGAIPEGWGAAYDLLSELDLPVTRTRQQLSARPLTAVQWLIAPSFSDREAQLEASALTAFAERGGTVVLFGARDPLWRALGLATVGGPEAETDEAAPSSRGDDAAATDLLGSGLAKVVLHGALLPRARRADVPPDTLFVAETSDAVARVVAPRGAFVLERAVGRGRLVAVADAGFLTNGQLGAHEHARLLVDLAHAYGPPVFDERCHGLITEPSVLSLLGPTFVGLSTIALSMLMLALLLFARRWPASTRRAPALEPPTLTVFVDALAALYEQAGRRGADAVFRAYRSGLLRRLARAWYGLSDVSGTRFEARLHAEAAALGADGACLRGDARIHTRAELTRAVAVLERVLETAQGKKGR